MPLIIEAKIKHSGGGAVADAQDVTVNGIPLTDYLPEEISEEDYNALKAAGKTIPTKLYVFTEESQ